MNAGTDCAALRRDLHAHPGLGFEERRTAAVVAGCHVFISDGGGVHRASGHSEGPCMLHNPSVDFNDELLPPGASYWVRLARAPAGRTGTAALTII